MSPKPSPLLHRIHRSFTNHLRQPWVWIAVITLLAVWLRFYKLGSVPAAFFMDEAALGYNGWSLLTTARDEWGQLLPLTMRSFDDWKPAIYAYLTVPGIALLGMNEMTARLPAALIGSLLPLMVFLLLHRTTKRADLGLLTALVIAISPWHIEISRTAIEAGVALFLTVTATWLLTGKRQQSKWLGIGLLIGALFTYHSARLIAALIPLGLLSLSLLNRWQTAKKRGRSWREWLLPGALALLWGAGIALSFTASSARFSQISIFSDLGSVLKREEFIREAVTSPFDVPTWLARTMQNKPTSWVLTFTDSYLQNSSLHYLFLGGAQPPRVEIPETGQFLLIFLPLFILGLIVALRQWKTYDQWLLAWLVLAPIPAALTTAEIPHTYRTVFLLVPVANFIARGIASGWQGVAELSSRWQAVRQLRPAILALVLVVFSAAVAFNTWKFWFHYSVLQQVHRPWYRQYGYEILVSKMENEYSDASHITMTNREGEPYMFFLFYRQVPPRVYQASPDKRLAHSAIEAGADHWTLFDFYTFHESPCPVDVTVTDPTHYFITLPQCEVPTGFELVDTVHFLDGNPQFVILRPLPPILPEDPV